MPEVLLPDEVDEQQEIDRISPSALAVLNQSEHAAMVQTANLTNNRRRLAEFDSKLNSYANYSQPVALSMFYSLPRAGKQIIGPSVRFAEIVAPCWRNCAVAARVIGDTDSTVTAQGIFIDYEANLRNSIEVPRRITDKEGRRYNDDMVITTSNAGMAVARRNAVLKGGVPQALWQPAYENAQLTAVGKAMSHAQRVAEAMEYLHKLGVTEWQILNAVGVSSVKELETEHLLTMRVLCREIKTGDKTIEHVFGSAHDKEIDALFLQLKMNNTQQTMLKNSYMGRAEKLVEYLRERVGTARTVVGAPPQAQPEVRAERVPIVTSNPTIPDDNPRNTVSAAAPPPAPDPGPEPSAAAPAVGITVEETVAQKSTPAFNARQESGAQSDDKRDNPTIPDDSARPKVQEPFVNHPPQTSMEPPPRRRGRPTREEMAARRAAENQDAEPPEEETIPQFDF